MQYVPGGSIANIVTRFGALEEEVFCNYTRQILEGVQYLHANNVIHRLVFETINHLYIYLFILSANMKFTAQSYLKI